MKAKRVIPALMLSALAFSSVALAEEAATVVDFEDGNVGFVAMDTAPGDASECEFEVVDWNGSKALKVNAEDGKVPYIGIDIASLTGDKIADIRTIEFTIGAEGPDGEFYAVSGDVNTYIGEDRTMSTSDWSVYMAKKNPKVATVKLTDDQVFAADAQNIMIITKGNKSDSDVSMFKGEGPNIIYIDDIRFLDADGNAIAVDTTVEFDKPAGFGAADMSNLTGLLGENVIDGATGSSAGSWGQAVALDTAKNGGTFDPAVIEPGTIISVYYTADTAPELVLQSWTEGCPETAGWAKVAATTDNGSVATYSYEAMVTAFGSEDFVTYLDNFIVGDTGSALSVTKVTVQ